MKHTLLIITALMLVVGCSKPIDGSTLVLKEQIIHTETYEDGNIKSITYHKKSRTGIEKVKYEEYFENGQKYEEETYKDGKPDGLFTEWYENGQKIREVTYKNGKKDGLSTYWYENGQKQWEATFKDGEQIGETKRY